MLISKCEVLGNYNLSIECHYNYDDQYTCAQDIASNLFIWGVRAVERDPQGRRYQLRALDKQFVMAGLVMRMNEYICDIQELVGPVPPNSCINPLFIADTEDRLHICYGLVEKLSQMSQGDWRTKLLIN